MMLVQAHTLPEIFLLSLLAYALLLKLIAAIEEWQHSHWSGI